MPDGLNIEGAGRRSGARVDSHEDHRIAMSLAVAGLAARGTTEIDRAHCVDISYPELRHDLARVAPGALEPGNDPSLA